MTHKDAIQAMIARTCRQLVQTMCEASEAYLYAARFDDALRVLHSDALESIDNHLIPEDRLCLQIQRAKIMRHRGYHSNDRDCYDAALEILFETLETAESVESAGLLADVVDLIGMTLYSKEMKSTSLESSLRYFEQGLVLRRSIGDNRSIVESLFHVGLVYQNKDGAGDDDRQKALEYFQQAYSLAEAGGFDQEKGHVARHIGYLCSRRGELDRALAYHLEFLAANEECGFWPYLPPAHVMVGFAYHAQNESKKALAHFEQACTLAKQIGAKPSLAESLIGIGIVKERQGKPKTALKFFHRALAASRSSGFEFGAQIATKRIENLSNLADEK